jgi:carboxyl-terminal processing protease
VAPIVKVSGKETEIEYYFEVSDNGIGIKKEHQASVFKIFKQLNNKAEFEGSGIGLNTVLKILKKYNGSIDLESTFGKGTVQRFVDLDRFYRDQENLNLGNLKITMQKFFRVDGGSTQLKGVTPDVILPNNYHYIKTGEKDYEHAMEWSEIKPVEYSQDVYQVTNKEALAKKSAQRIANNDDFNLILENARRLKENKDLTEYPIGYNEYVEYVESKEKEAEKFDDLFDNKVEGLIVKNLEIDSTYINFDESRVERNKEWIEALEKDIYIEEVMHIINDMIDTHDKMAVVKEK